MTGRLKKVLSSRLFITAIFCLMQFALIVALMAFSARTSWVYALFTIFSMVAIIWLSQRRDNPSYKLAWAILILALPVFGWIFYLMWGGKRIGFQARAQLRRVYPDKVPAVDKSEVMRLRRFDEQLARQAEYIANVAAAPVYANSGCVYFPNGEQMLPRMLKELQKAQRFIFMEYFIIETGVMWESILEILTEKAAQGVDVRLMYDDFGCILKLPPGYHKMLEKRGIKVAVFNRIRPRLDAFMNSRDHRKICVVDGNVGFMGGINLADEYINAKSPFGYWKDTAVMVRGEAVYGFTKIFSELWKFSTSQQIPLEQHMPTLHYPSDGFIQPFADQPLDELNVSETAYLAMINNAAQYLYITTPYLILDNEVMTALCMAARSGVDVRIVTPGIPDKKGVYLVTRANYAQLVEAGVRIYEYTPGFIHAKMFVSDDKAAIVGTANMDFRSLYLNFECCTAFYYSSVVDEVRNDILKILQQSRQITPEILDRVPRLQRIFRSILRIFSPLM